MRQNAEMRFMKILRDCQRKLGNRVSFAVPTDDGGPGSGNWGHKGRPGQVGGSGKGGGNQYRGGRGDIGYFSSKHDWLNGLKGERQHEASTFLKTFKEFYISPGDNKSVEEAIMQNGSTKRKRELLGFMEEARGWDRNAKKLVDENLSDQEKVLTDFLGKMYGVDPKTGMPDDSDMAGWDSADKKFWLDMKSKAMGGPSGGHEPSDELMYQAGLKERPKPKTDQTWFKNANPDSQEAAMGALERASRMELSPEDFDTGDGIMEAEKAAFENGYSDYMTQRALKVYLAQKWYCSDVSDFSGEIYDRLDPVEYANFRELIEEAKKKGDPSPLDTLDYKNNRERMEGYALINKALGGADVTEDILQKNREAFQKEEEERKRQLEELKRQNEERQRIREERERAKAEEKARRAPIIKAVKERLKDDGMLDAINNAKTAQEAASVLNLDGMFTGEDKADFSGMNTETAKAAANAYSDVYQAFPFLVGELGSPMARPSAYFRSGAYAHSFLIGGRVEFNTKYYEEQEKIDRQYQRDIQSEWHPKGTDWRAITYHELGHSLDGWLTGHSIGGSSITGKKTTEFSYLLRKTVMKSLGFTYTGDKGKRTVKENLSDYANKDNREWFAECLCEAMCSKNPRPVAQACMNALKKILKESGLESGLNEV